MNPNEERISQREHKTSYKTCQAKKQQRRDAHCVTSLIDQFLDIEVNCRQLSEGQTPDVDPATPNKSTGINMLEQLLKKIIPVLEEDYKSLTTNKFSKSNHSVHIS